MSKIIDTFDFSLAKNKKTNEFFMAIKDSIEIERQCMNETLEYKFHFETADDVFQTKIKATLGEEKLELFGFPLFKHVDNNHMEWMSEDVQDVIKKMIQTDYLRDPVFLKVYTKYKYIFDDIFQKDVIFKVNHLNNLPLFIALFNQAMVCAKFLSEDGKCGFYYLFRIHNEKKQNIFIDDIFKNVKV